MSNYFGLPVGHEVIAAKRRHENSDKEWIVLAQQTTESREYICWYFNAQTLELYGGDYCSTYLEASKVFTERGCQL